MKIQLTQQFYVHLVYVLISFVLSSNTTAQNPAYFQYTTENGLPSNVVYSILIDHEGFLWAGTDGGLVKYNGFYFQPYESSVKKTRSLTGLTLLGTEVFTYSFNGQLFTTHADSLREIKAWKKKISNISSDRSGLLWITSDEGIFAYKPSTDKIFGPFHPEEKFATHAVGIASGNQGVFTLFENGLAKISNFKMQIIPFKRPENTLTGQYQLSTGEDYPWIFGFKNTEIYRYKNNQYLAYQNDSLQIILSETKVNYVKELSKNELWICTNNGLIIHNYKNGKTDHYFKHIAISDVCFDSEGSLWIATLHNGIIQIPDLSNRVWRLMHENEWDNSPMHMSYGESQLIYTTAGGNYGKLNTQTGEVVFLQNFEYADIQAIYMDENTDQLLYFTNNKLIIEQDNKRTISRLNLPPVKCILPINAGYVFGTSNGTCFAKNLQDTSFIYIQTSWTRSLYFETEQQTLFICTNNGLVTYKLKNDEWIFSKEIIPDLQIITIKKSIEHSTYYALCFDGNVYQINDKLKATQVYQVPDDNLPNDFVISENYLYVAGNKGIDYISADGQDRGRITKYEGLVANEVRSILIQNDTLWISTEAGIQMLKTPFEKKTTQGNIYLESIYSGENKLNQIDNIELNYHEPLLIICEVAHYCSEQNYSLQYRFKNDNSSWISLPAKNGEINIPSIPSGYFKLEIKYTDHAGNDSNNTIIISGYVFPPWWQRWWFYTFEGVLLFAILVLIFRYRIYRLKKKQAIQIKNMRIEHELKLARETALKAQMNPHFIFNVLNSIKSFIYQSDREKAIFYLNEFSGLIRHTLQNSARQNILLCDEIECLKSYIQLEKMLLDTQFEFEIYVDPNLDETFIKIQPMLIQPFVENAFLHGLRHKQGYKKLRISFQLLERGDGILVTIEDNGIGRQASAKINLSRDKKHSSFGAESVLNRLKLSKQPDQFPILLIEDLPNEAGTKVTIQINLQT